VLKIDTTDVTFDRDKEFASTAKTVQFQFPNAEGKAVGMKYDSKSGAIDLDHDVEIHLVASQAANPVPVVLNGNALRYDRNARVARLMGAARARQGEREITAETMVLELDADMHARHATASGHPEMRTLGGPESIFVKAGEFESALSPAGWIETVSGKGNVEGERKGLAGTSHFAAQAADVAMEPKTNQPRTMHSSGDVDVDIRGKNGGQQIHTMVLDLAFAAGLRASQRRIDTAMMPEPSTMIITQSDGVTRLKSQKARGEFDTQSRLRKFYGDSGVQIFRNSPAGVPQKTTARDMVTSFNDAGQWDTIDLDGDVRFNEADRSGEARHARLVQATNMTWLDGAPAISDATSRTTATSIELQQDSGAVNAAGAVRTTYRGNGAAGGPSFGSGVAVISGDTLTGSTKTGHLIYAGHGHLFQGDSVLDAQTIELWRDERRMDAKGNVVAVFPQAADSEHPGAAPTLWKVRAPTLRYWDNLGRAHLEEGVFADSVGQTIRSKTLDVFLTAASPAGGAAAGPATGAKAGGSAGSGVRTTAKTGAGSNGGAGGGTSGGGGSRQLDHALALGDVTVTQGDKRATGERADYTAADEKFVMSGGKPTFTDAENNTTTGRSLTFYRASDTILVDSEAGSRTLTKHRVEK
jgi:lipopolysaccharide export system protein LptA